MHLDRGYREPAGTEGDEGDSLVGSKDLEKSFERRVEHGLWLAGAVGAKGELVQRLQLTELIFDDLLGAVQAPFGFDEELDLIVKARELDNQLLDIHDDRCAGSSTPSYRAHRTTEWLWQYAVPFNGAISPYV